MARIVISSTVYLLNGLNSFHARVRVSKVSAELTLTHAAAGHSAGSSFECAPPRPSEPDLACHRLGYEVDQSAANGLAMDSAPGRELHEAAVADSTNVACLAGRTVEGAVAKVAAVRPRG